MGQLLAAIIDTDPGAGIGDGSFEQRADNRRCLSLQVAGSAEAQQDFNATVRDLSRFGFLMDSTTSMTAGELIYVEFPRLGRVSAEVAWTEGRMAGCRFLQPISSGALSAALLRALPQPAPVAGAGPSVHLHPGADDELSPRQKALVLIGLAMASWAVLLAVGYAGLHLLTA